MPEWSTGHKCQRVGKYICLDTAYLKMIPNEYKQISEHASSMPLHTANLKQHCLIHVFYISFFLLEFKFHYI